MAALSGNKRTYFNCNVIWISSIYSMIIYMYCTFTSSLYSMTICMYFSVCLLNGLVKTGIVSTNFALTTLCVSCKKTLDMENTCTFCTNVQKILWKKNCWWEGGNAKNNVGTFLCVCRTCIWCMKNNYEVYSIIQTCTCTCIYMYNIHVHVHVYTCTIYMYMYMKKLSTCTCM